MKLNKTVEVAPIYTHGGARATPTNALNNLRRSVLTCLLWEDSYYESGSEIAKNISDLIPQVKPEDVVDLAYEARDRMQLRHIP